MDVILHAMITSVNLLQLENAFCPIDSTLIGMEILVRPECEKVLLAIFVKLFGMFA